MNARTLFSAIFLCLNAVAIGHALPANSVDETVPASEKSGGYVARDIGANHCVWSKSAILTNELGQTRKGITSSYTELATGLAYNNGGRWERSNEKFSIVARGAEATNAAHKLSFLGNPNQAGAVRLTTPEGKELISSVLGLSYYDQASGRSVMIGQIRDAQGTLTSAGNEALYVDAFSGVRADLLYVNQVAGMEQFAVIREQLPSPAEWGLEPASTMLELITEFSSAPEPQVREVTTANGPDDRISFGVMAMDRGYAFALGSETNKIRVTKQWLLMEGRRCLVERVPYLQIKELMKDLPPASSSGASLKTSPDSVLHRVASNRLLPHRRSSSQRTVPFIAGGNSVSGAGFVMDYTMLSSQTNLVLHGDTTYLVSGTVNVISNTIVEGGAVVKFTPSGSASIISSNIICKTDRYRPAVFTGKDDDTVGDQISGSTGNPTSNYYGGIALDLSGSSPATIDPGTGQVLKNFRFSFLDTVLAGSGITLRNCQIQNCNIGFGVVGTIPHPSFYNVLVNQVRTVVDTDGKPGDDAVVVNVTAHSCGKFMADDTSSVTYTNCLFALVTNWFCATTVTNSSVFLGSDTGIFQTVAAGAHYLIDESPYRNAGNDAIDSTLLGDLKKRTTYPPLVRSNVTERVDTVLAACIQRDTDAPDLGYHYDPLDYITASYIITNATLTIRPGTVISYLSMPGVWLQGGAPIICEGTAQQPACFVNYHSVQEAAVRVGAGTSMPISNNRQSGSAAPAQFRFTDFYRLGTAAYDAYQLYALSSGWTYTTLAVQDCQIFGGTLLLFPGSGSTFTFTNNLVNVTSLNLVGECAFEGYNNLFLRAIVYMEEGGSPFVLRNNAFDSGSWEDDLGNPTTHEYNAFINNPVYLSATHPSDLVLTNFIYETGALGDYYQASTDLIDQGSTTADVVGLYQYTTQAVADDKEYSSTVDIGFHYVAVDGSGNPKDSNGNGFPDYQEDANGNGSVDSGETDWGYANDLGLKVWITEPKRNSNIP